MSFDRASTHSVVRPRPSARSDCARARTDEPDDGAGTIRAAACEAFACHRREVWATSGRPIVPPRRTPS